MRVPRLIVLIALLLGRCKSSKNTAPQPPPLAKLPQVVPLVGFVPFPANVNPPDTGSVDYDALFEEGAPWSEAMAKIGFFGLFGDWVQGFATDAQMQTDVAFLNAHGLPIGIEMAMIEGVPACAINVEGSVPQTDFVEGTVKRIHDAGGVVRIMRADDPWSSHLLSGNPCNWTATDVATRLAATAAKVRAIEPGVLIEDTDTLSQNITAQQLFDFVDAYTITAGRPLDGFVLDIDYSRPGWGPEAVAFEAAIKSRGIRFGVTYHGDLLDLDDASWSARAESRFSDYELVYGGKPDEVMLESWMHYPQHVLPETQNGAFTNLVDRYFLPRPALAAALSGTAISGTLNAADGTPMAGAAVDATATLTSGDGVPDDFSAGPWFTQGSGSAALLPSDQGAGQMMEVTSTPTQTELAQVSGIAVTAGQTYVADFHARIPPAAVDTGVLVVIFLDADNNGVPDDSINYLSFAAATTTASGVTDGSGAYSMDLGAPPTDASVAVWYRGDDSHFAAYAHL